MDEVEGRRADNAPSAASERKRQRKKSSRSRPSSSTQPSQPPHATSATVFKSSASNATSRSLRSQRMDDRSDSEAAVAQPVASSSRSPTNIEAPPPTNGAISSSASSEEDNASRSAMSATPPHKRRKKKNSTSPVQGQQQQPSTSASTTIPHLGGARARMMAQDRERQLCREQEEQESSTQESSLAPVASTSRAAMDELEKSLLDARQARAGVDAELVRLRNEMRFKNEVIAAQSSALSYLHTQATCTICLELAWRPHVLSPCGHTFCARCLVDWFKRPLPDEVPAPSWMVGDELRAFEEDQTQRRKKLCPHCRTKVEGPPAEVWAVKGMVDRLHQSHMAGLMAGAEGGGENHLGATVERTAAEEAQLRGEDLLSGAELWKPIFDENGGRRRIFDETDMIWRCGHCTGEIAWGECQNCHRAYTMTDDGDEEDDPDGLLYSDDYPSDEDEDDANDVIDSLARGYRLDNAHGGHDDEDEHDEANSFIVSDADSADLGYYSSDVSAPGIVVDDSEYEDHHGHHAHYHHAGPPRRRHGYSDEDEDESEDDNDGASSSSIESGSPRHHQMAAQHNRRRHPHRLAIEDDEEEDDDDEDGDDEDGDEDNVNTMLDGPSTSSSSRGAVPHGRRRHHLEDLSDDQSESGESAIADVINHDLAVESEDEYVSESEDEEGDSSNVSRFVGHGSTTTRGGRHVSPIQQRRGNGRYLVVSDSEEEQDDHDDGYQGGRHHQPHASGSRYDEYDDDDDSEDSAADDGVDDEDENADYDDDDDEDGY